MSQLGELSRKYLKFNSNMEGRFAEKEWTLFKYRSSMGFNYPDRNVVYAKEINLHGKNTKWLLSFEKHGLLFIKLATFNKPSALAESRGRSDNLIKNCLADWNYYLPNSVIKYLKLDSHCGYLFGAHKKLKILMYNGQEFNFIVKKRSMCRWFNRKCFDRLPSIIQRYNKNA